MLVLACTEWPSPFDLMKLFSPVKATVNPAADTPVDGVVLLDLGGVTVRARVCEDVILCKPAKGAVFLRTFEMPAWTISSCMAEG